jgi:hypothetical protein
MTSSFVQKILDRIGQPELVNLLSHDLSGTELNSLLLEVFHARASAMNAGQLMKTYRQNRFVKPADLPVIQLRQMELDLLRIFEQASFTPIELSPVSVFGACSVVGPASQHKILSALRGTEVLADATNAIALHIADLRQSEIWKPDNGSMIRFSAIQRHVRTQMISGKGFTPHFKIGCLVTGGTDTGSNAFEKASLRDHIAVMKEVYLSYYKVQGIKFRFICREDGHQDPVSLAMQVKDHVIRELPGTEIEIVDITYNNKTYEIGDGGFVDWTKQLLQNRKERMLSTGIGFEYMHRIVCGEV